MVGFPIRRWCLQFGKRKQNVIANKIFQHKKSINRIQGQGSPTPEARLAISVEQELVDMLDWQSFLIEAWHKPLITCAACMTSVHGFLISAYFYSVIEPSIIYIFPFSVMLSAVINSFIWKRL